MAALPRLHVEDPRLAAEVTVVLDADRTHYLGRVLRLAAGDAVSLFNAEDGEWRARILSLDRRRARLLVEEPLRPPRPEPGPTLWFAPPRRVRLEWLVEKAVELGVARLCPVLTARSVARPRRADRLHAIAVEAAEQCRRLTVPPITEARTLETALAEEAPFPLLFADEAGGGRPLLEALDAAPEPAMLVGPEGGFTPEERAMLRAHPGVTPVGLGATVLRTETAALYMLAAWRARREVTGE